MSFMMSMNPSPSSPPPPLSSPSESSSTPSTLPVRTIPGSYGWPLLGPISDRLDYFWFQGPDTFFRKRVEKYKSTVFRTNIPPTFPFFSVNPNIVAVLDCKSFSHLFDMEIVEKKNVLVGDFMPSVNYTGDIRVGAYLDTSEPQHAKVKNFAMDVLKQSSKIWVGELTSNLSTMWDTIEKDVSEKPSSSYLAPLQKFLFNFLVKCLIGADPSNSPKIAESGYIMLDRWLAFQLLPTIKIGILQPLEELFIHSFAYPFFLVSGDYNNLSSFVEEYGKEIVARGETEFGLSKQEAIHNLLFILGFNAFGGFSIFLPSLLGTVASDTTDLQQRLVKEVRQNGGSTLTFDSIKEMPLVQSVVYETLRLNPPVPLQFARARKDFRLSSHDAAFEVKKGELLCGFQSLVMRDPKIFSEPESFIGDRFMKDKGLLDYLYWSNGPQTGVPSVANKQCAGKDIVTLTACLILAYTFRRYDSISGSSSSITALKKA
ncbi:hypothetical protein F8388_015513 [Cannabis sativa]|uniref:Uncharacterized protein n=1 Tax=Cannabis sativa TaxID=3483 RepID=A0A7J6GIC8_CANSA|nr:hypothetical protein F8388_015513 [Cannabis sativa]